MTKQNILNGVVLVGLVVLGFIYTARPSETIIREVKTGAVVSSELPNNNFSFGEVRSWAYGPRMNVATTTLCAIKSPAATSSLRSASFNIFTGTSTAATIDLATSTTAFATTTNLVSAFSVGSGATGNVSWFPSGTNSTIAPNTYVIVKTAGAGLGGYTYGGRCSAVFQEL